MADAVDESYELAAQGRLDEALAVIEPRGKRPEASHAELAAWANALKGLGRLDEAMEVYRRAVRGFPSSGIAYHNLAALLCDIGRNAEAEAEARKAFAKGLDAPETWAVLARSLQGLGRLDEAEAAFRESLRRDPTQAGVHRDFAQLIWTRTENVAAATAALRSAATAFPTDPALIIQLAKALQFGGQEETAYAALIGAIGRVGPGSAELQVAASNLAGAMKETVAALRHAEEAYAVRPDDPSVILALVDAQLGMGRPGPAARLAEALHERLANQQQVLARLATAWRLMDDPRYGRLYDYAAMVRGYTIETPEGWSDLPAYLPDLAAALRAAHRLKGHPYDQSLRGGSQTHTDLTLEENPAIAAFFKAIDAPIRAHMQALGEGSDPLRRRNTGRYAVQGAWSVRLRPNGFHVDHVHQLGWLSSAFHVELPPAVQGGEREGWLKFGEPGIATQPALPPEHFVKPEPGRLVLFPSYMWHGTTPFAGEEDRLTIAFDVVPA